MSHALREELDGNDTVFALRDITVSAHGTDHDLDGG